MTDVRMTHTLDGGEIEVLEGRFTLDDGPATAAYLSLFGGNELDDGSAATAAKQWWGNLTESNSARQMRSETQHLLRALPATSGNLTRLADAAKRDLGWMVDALGAELDVRLSIPARNRVTFAITVEIDGRKTPIRFTAPWETAS